MMTDTQPETVHITIPKAEWDEHVKRVNFLTGTLAALLNALGQHPMFAGFVPPDIREQISQLQ